MSHASSSSWGVPTSSWGYNVGMCRSIARGCQCSAQVSSGLTLTGPHIPDLLVTHTFSAPLLIPPADFTTALYHGRHREGASLVVPSSTGLTSTSQIKEIEGEFCLPSSMSLCSFTNRDWSTEEMARSTRLEPVPSSNMGLIFPYSAEE